MHLVWLQQICSDGKPMSGPLKNAKHEAFARYLARGMSETAAYVKAGYRQHAGNACTLAKSQKIIERIQSLLEKNDLIDRRATDKAVEKLAITKESILAELAKIGFANMLDYINVAENGDATVNLSKLDRDKAACIQEVTTEHYMEGEGEDAKPMKRIKFKLMDKKGALVDMGKHIGMFIQKIEHGGPGDFSDKSEDELLDMDERLAGELEEVIMHDGTDSVN